MRKNLLAFGVLLLLILSGCATTTPVSPPMASVRVESTPDHATVYWSKNETGPWSTWDTTGGRHVTPTTLRVPEGDYYWIKVGKPDYLDSEPQFVRPVGGHDAELVFDLEMEPEKYAALQRAKGLALHNGEWVDPAAAGLIQQNGRWVDPKEEGLINYRGRWVRPTDEGLVFADGQWITPAERDERMGIARIPDTEAMEPEATVAEGIAAVMNGDLAAARQAAIDNALNNALQQQMGLHMKSSRVSENYILMKYRIESETSGVVDSYDILEEANDADFYWVKLEVVFREDVIKSKNLDKTRVLIAGDEVFVTDSVLFTSTLALQEMASAFAEAGFRVVGGPDASWNLRTDVFDASVFETYREQAKFSGADLLAVINAKSQLADKFGNLVTFNTNIEGRVVKAETGEIVAAKTMELRGDRKLTEPEAGEVSLAKAGREMGDYLIGQIVNRYEGLISHTLMVSGVKSRGQADLIVRELRTCKSVKSASLLEYDWETARIEVELTPTANEFFPECVNRLQDVHLKVVRSLRCDTVARVY